MEDFLSLPPELTYADSHHSDRSHSPSSSHDVISTAEHEWHEWRVRDLTAMTDVDSLFPLETGDILFTEVMNHDFTIEDAPEQLQRQTIPKILSSFESDRNVTLPAHVNDFPNIEPSRAKRKLSESSSDDLCDQGSASSTSQNRLLRPEELYGDITLTKKRATIGKAPKVSHNIIEKRYRSNLNDKILDLRDVVPQLKAEAESGNAKQAKGKIIIGATEYIKELEAKNAKLLEENNRLTAKLHGEDRSRSGGTLSRVVVGGLAGMMCVSGLQDGPESGHLQKRNLDGSHIMKITFFENTVAVVKMILLIAAIFYIFSPDLFATHTLKQSRSLEKYSQSPDDDCSQEDVQENRELMHNNVSAMLEMPCDRPGLCKRILQGCFVLALKIIIGQSGWNVLINKGLDYSLTNQRACSLLIETQMLGGDKYINQAKLFLSAIQSLGYCMPKEMRAIHFAMVCHGYAPRKVLLWCISLFWKTSTSDEAVLQLPLDQLLSGRVLEAIWSWTTGVEDPLIASVRNDETIDTPIKQLSAIHASLMQNHILRNWVRGTATAAELDSDMRKLLLYCPADSRITTNSLYLQSIIEPNDWLEQAMLHSMRIENGNLNKSISPRDVTMQLRCCVLLHLLEKNPKSEEVSDVLRMAEVETSSLLPGYSSRIIASCIAKHKLDDDDGISEALRRICARIGSVPKLELR